VKIILQDAETELKTCCDDLFEKVFRDFDHVCPQKEDDGFQALEKGKVLRKEMEEAKEVLEGPVKEALASAGIREK
jgi:hypothetical protein